MCAFSLIYSTKGIKPLPLFLTLVTLIFLLTSIYLQIRQNLVTVHSQTGKIRGAISAKLRRTLCNTYTLNL